MDGVLLLLREGAWRLNTVDAIVENGPKGSSDMSITATAWVNAKTHKRKPLSYFDGKKLHAVAGIGNPQRFFSTLDDLNVEHVDHVFVDHHHFIKSDLKLADGFSDQLVMTEKDWVKCAAFADESMWYLEISACLDDQLESKLLKDLTALVKAS